MHVRHLVRVYAFAYRSETLVSQQGRSLPSKVFSFALTSSGGRLVLGGVGSNVESSGKPPIKWCDVIQPAGFWSIAVDSFKSSKSDNELGQGKTIAIDTGTTGIIMDISTVQAFFSDPAAVDLHALDSNKWDLGRGTSSFVFWSFHSIALPPCLIKGNMLCHVMAATPALLVSKLE